MRRGVTFVVGLHSFPLNIKMCSSSARSRKNIEKFFDVLVGTQYFTKLDMIAGYRQIRM
jgi:hypothetical protein